MLEGELDRPAGDAIGGARPGGDGTAPLREAEKAHAGGVFALDKAVVPAVPSVGEQDGRVLDAGAIVGDGDGCGGSFGPVTVEGDVDTAGSGAPRVLQGLVEDVDEA